MRRPQGYAVWRHGNDGNAFKEHDTILCGHCSLIDLVPPGAHPADRCLMCMRFICGQCAGKAECRPFEKHLEAIESRGRLLASSGIAEERLTAQQKADKARIDRLFEEHREWERKPLPNDDRSPIEVEFDRRVGVK